jgi:hypothetical protein
MAWVGVKDLARDSRLLLRGRFRETTWNVMIGLRGEKRRRE